MNPTLASEPTAGLIADLQAFRRLCEQFLALATQENQALAGQAEYLPNEFHQKRMGLLPRLESALITLRNRRQAWQQTHSPGRRHSEDVKQLFQSIQSLLTRILLLDRDNQQALLRRGLVPARHLPPAAAQQPHFVTGLYQRHSRS